MFSKRIKHLAIALFIALSGGLVLVPSIASADFKGDACQGLNSIDSDSGGSSSCPDSAGSLTHLLSIVIQILSIVVGVAAVIMIIVGGLRFITSGGDSSNAASARNTILYAIIGLVIAVLAQVLVHFVLERASSGSTNGTSTSTSSNTGTGQ